MLYRAGLSFIPQRLVLSVFGTACFATFVGAFLIGWFFRLSVHGATCFFWVRHTTVAVLSARGYHGVLLQHFCYA
jgi:hypothetical protein